VQCGLHIGMGTNLVTFGGFLFLILLAARLRSFGGFGDVRGLPFPYFLTYLTARLRSFGGFGDVWGLSFPGIAI
jgi:hypothetical protein